MEYDSSLTFVEPKSGLCKSKRCTFSKDTFLQRKAATHRLATRHSRFANPRTFLQRTHFHEFWRDSILLVVCMMMFGWPQQTTAQGFLLPSYSEYTSTFEWYNPDSLDPEGINVCLRDRLAPALDVLPRRKILNDCEKMDVFNPATCRAFRDGYITIKSLFVHVNVVECCDGWLQSHTSCTQRCPLGTYGANCLLTCQCGGKIQLGCHHITGECFCPTGRTGKICETTCAVAKNSYGPNCARACPVCRHGGVCDPVSGECLCPASYTGRTCDRRCKDGNCKLDCALCDNEAACDRELGKCLCNPGWRGRYCTNPCPEGTYGTGCSKICTCLNKGVCLPEDGSCVCPTGWIGANCETVCPESYYGDQCEMRCDCPDGRCDSFTGDCFCPKGRLGPSCITECPEGFFGKHCAKKCTCPKHFDCDPVSGVCYKIREIITTTSITTEVNTTTPGTTTTTDIQTTKPQDKVTVTQFVPILTASPSETPMTQKPSRIKTQIVIGTSLGGVLVLAVLLTIAFIWIVFQRRDSTKGAKPINLKHQNKNNNSETPVPPDSAPPSLYRSEPPATQPPAAPKPKLPIPPKLPRKPKILQKSLDSLKLLKEPVYESISADQLEKEKAKELGSENRYSYCSPKTPGFNNPFYSKGAMRPVPSFGSIKSLIPSPFTRSATVHSTGGKSVKEGGRGYEVPICEIELKNRPSRGKSLHMPPSTGPFGGYLELSRDRDLRDTTGVYVGLLNLNDV